MGIKTLDSNEVDIIKDLLCKIENTYHRMDMQDRSKILANNGYDLVIEAQKVKTIFE